MSLENFTRRRFLGTAGAALAATAARQVLALDPSTGGPTLGFNTYGMKTLTTEEALRELAKIGFDTIELDSTSGCDADPANLPPARRAGLRKLAADLRLKFTAIQGLPTVSANDQAHEKSLELFRALAHLAHDLDPVEPPVLEVVLGGKEPWEKMKPLFIRRVADWVREAETSDARIVIKPHRDTSMDLPQEAIELIQALGLPKRLRMSYDYSHFALRDLPMDETIRTALPWTGFVAIKDVAMENGRSIFKLPGETRQIDYPALIRQFHAGGYRGDYNCEISAMIFRKPGFDCLAAARTSYANLAPAFALAGVARVKRT